MFRFHQTRFETIIENILEVVGKHGAAFTFPIVASVAGQKPELLRKIMEAKCEIAVHGYNHVKYSLISAQRQEADLRHAVESFRRLGIEAKGFRAPYNAYNEHTPEIIERLGFSWDGGLGYKVENRTKTDFFRLQSGGRELNFACAPLNELSDDLMIDEKGYSPEEMMSLLNGKLDWIRGVGGLIMFDLHPIRIGQPEYIEVLDGLLKYGNGIGGWFPTVSEALRVRSSGRGWNGHEFCCLLTGDVDNFYFRDYLRRLR